ncbi:MAG: TetR/AcrR family transcriptional regulator [Acidimicrobiales bacterium]
MNRRLTPHGRERRRQLLDFAAGLFADNGYHRTSVAEIVQGLGVGKGVFYWYFSSKEELFLDILQDAHRGLRRAQQDAIGDEADPLRRLELGIRASMSWFEAQRRVFKLFQFAATDDRFAPALRRGQEVAAADTVRHVKDAIVEGRIRDLDPDLVSHAILAVTGHLAQTFVLERGRPATEIADAAVAFCLGVRGEPPAPDPARP